MLYVVCAYIAVSLIALILLPEHPNPKPKYTKTIFDWGDDDTEIEPEMPYEPDLLDAGDYDCYVQETL